jgi:proteasome lid subunit RPN8/RPN11
MPEPLQPRFIHISHQDWEIMRSDVARRAPEEACGLLAGRRAGTTCQVTIVFPMTNLLHSATRYRLDPAEQLAVFDQIDSLGLELVGIYHSHPAGPDHASPTDIAEAYYPEAVYLIWFVRDGEWACNAFTIVKRTVSPVDIRVIQDFDPSTAKPFDF